MTERLFDKDSYIKEFDAECIGVNEEKGKFYIELNKTCFFPEGGGQKGDRGKLNNIEVVDTIVKDGTIYHICNKKVEVGEKVHGEIFWDERYAKMQNHTAEHIISGIVNKKYGYENVGFRLADNFVTMDYNGILRKDDIEFIENEANKISNANLMIKTYFPENTENLTYRSKLDIKENLRIVEIPDVDVCACCAPHLKQTGETGMIKIINSEKNKGGTRLTMKSGIFALREFTEIKANISKISELLSLPETETAQGVEKLLKKTKMLEEKQKNDMLIKVFQQANSSLKPYLFIENPDFLKEAVNTLKQRFDCTVGAFASTENGFRFMMLSENCEAVAQVLKDNLVCFGGGRNGMVQGNIKGDKNQIENVLEKFIFAKNI